MTLTHYFASRNVTAARVVLGGSVSSSEGSALLRYLKLQGDVVAG